MDERTRFTAIEADVPDSLPADSWREVLDVVAEADRFGLVATSGNDRTLWAVVNNPASPRATSGDRAISNRS
ncbi:hypothetical protein GCM10010431_70190 [Streptomyces kunmingensis]